MLKKLQQRMKDVYVSSMLVLAGGIPPPARKSCKAQAELERRVPMAREVSMRRASDFERRVMLCAYNIIMAAPQGLISSRW